MRSFGEWNRKELQSILYPVFSIPLEMPARASHRRAFCYKFITNYRMWTNQVTFVVYGRHGPKLRPRGYIAAYIEEICYAVVHFV